MIQQDDSKTYTTSPLPYYASLYSPVGVIDKPLPTTPPPSETSGTQPPEGPRTSHPAPPQRQRRRGGAILLLTLILALVLATGLFAGWVFAGAGSKSITTTATTTTTTTTASGTATIETLQEQAIAKVEPAVVELQVTTADGEQIGSGIIVDAKGDIVTNNHVVSGGQSVVAVLSNGNNEQAQIIGTDAADDLAIVRIAPFAHMTVIQIADSSKLTVGQEVLAIGNPLGITETATEGIISALNRSVTESRGVTLNNTIQTDAAVNPGNSGGALINLQGQLVGIPTLTAIDSESNTAASGLSFAIPSNTVQSVIQQLTQ